MDKTYEAWESSSNQVGDIGEDRGEIVRSPEKKWAGLTKSLRSKS
jgi:hypothetical protein